jgi:serine protease
MATRHGHDDVRSPRRRVFALAIALSGAFASPSMGAGSEIALRFYDDNPAARGNSLSSGAQAAIEKTAGTALLAKGRDTDGAFRFGFAAEPSPADVRNVLNKLRATGAVIYADVASDDRSSRAKQYAPLREEPVTSLLVRMKGTSALKAATGVDTKSRLAAKSGVAIAQARSLADGSQVVMLESPLSPRAVEQVLKRLAADDDVAHVEIDRRARTQAQPSDPMYATQWNLTDPVGGIAAPRAWDITTGDPNAPVAILDTGVLPHPDLAARVVGGYDFVADSRFSNDGDGRDPDPSDPGDFVTTAESTTPGSPLQGCAAGNSTWHGTMVAGTLGAAVNNGNGMSGVNWASPLLNVRVLGKCGGALSDVADGIRWAAGLPVPGVPANSTPARVINLSLSGLGDCGPILQSAVTDALASGAVIIAAAGNDNDDVANHWPANCNGVIAVAATSKNGSRAFYTNSGSRIAVSAPGGGIGGSIPVLRNSGTTVPDPNGYGYGQQLGSSLAAPHISGIASLVFAMDRNLTPAEVRGLIESNARAFPDVATDPCSTSICGAGIADAALTISRLAPNGPVAPPPGRQPPPTPSPVPAPLPTPAPPTPAPLPGADMPPAALAPVPGGWRAKSPAELDRLLKDHRLVGSGAPNPTNAARDARI